MATQSRNKKKPTKKQIQQNIVNHYENSLKENFIKNMVMGFEVASQMYLDKIESGCTLDELKELSLYQNAVDLFPTSPYLS